VTVTYRCSMCGATALEPAYSAVMHSGYKRHPEVFTTPILFCSPFCAARYMNAVCELEYLTNRIAVSDETVAVRWATDMTRTVMEIGG
jgi:hypothetical protein